MDFINREVVLHVLKKDVNNENVKLLDWKVLSRGDTAYTSYCELLEVEYETDAGRQKNSFFVKFPCDATSAIISALRMHEKEVYIYKAILSEFDKFTDYRISPVCYYSDDKNNLILEDLCTEGYRVYRQYEFLDFEHSVQVMKVLSVYHAVSYKLSMTKPEIFKNELMQEYFYNTLVRREKNINVCRKGVIKLLQRANPPFANKYADKLKIFAENLLPNAVKELKTKKNAFNVLVHCDFRTANMLFKYDKYENLESIKIIDHQTAIFGDPSIDIINYIMQSVEFEIFDKYFDVLLEIYINSLNRLLNYFQCDRTYSINELKADIETKYNFWIHQMISAVPMSLANPNDVDQNLLYGDESIWDVKIYQPLAKKWFQYFIKKSLEGSASKVFLAD